MNTTAKRIVIGILANVVLCINAMALTDALKIKVINGTLTDETVIRFLPTATTGFDGSYDAYKMFSSSPTVPAIFSNIDPTNHLSINALPSLTTDVSVEVFIHIKVAGTYILQSIELGAFSTDAIITLEDKQEGTKYAFRNGTSISLPMTVNMVSSASRFVIHFSAGTNPFANTSSRPILRSMETTSMENANGASLNAYQVDNQLMIDLSTEEFSNNELYVFNTAGQLIYQQNNTIGSFSTQLNINTQGIYIVRLISNGELQTKKISITL